MTNIQLEKINRTNWRAALQLKVHPEQQRFVADVSPVAAIVLAKAYIRPGDVDWLPYGIYVDGQMVGLVALVISSASLCWMYHFFIDELHQGKGLGKGALDAFIQIVRREHPACEEIRLTVHPENAVAQRLYAGAGFVATGQISHGEPVYCLNLVKN